MNNVLLSSSMPEAVSASRATSSRPASSYHDPDTNADFAGVLAGQAMHQPAPNTAASPDNAGPSAESASRSGPKGSAHAADASGSHRNSDASQAGGTARTDSSGTHATQQNADGARVAAQARNEALPQAQHSESGATLPQRFREVIDAVSAVRSHGNTHTDSHHRDARPAGADQPENRLHTLAEALSRRSGRATVNGQAGTAGHAQTDTVRTSRGDIDASKQASVGRNSAEMVTGNGKRITNATTPNTDSDTFLHEAARFRAEATHITAGGTTHGNAEAIASNSMVSSPLFSLASAPVTGPDTLFTATTLNQPVFSPQWASELGRQFTGMIRPGENGNHIAELRLDPPELGPLRVTININDSVVQAVFSSAHASVRNAVEQALPMLQQQLEEEGLSLGQASVDDNPSSSQSSGQGGTTTLAGTHQADDASDTGPVARLRVADALVDTFA